MIFSLLEPTIRMASIEVLDYRKDGGAKPVRRPRGGRTWYGDVDNNLPRLGAIAGQAALPSAKGSEIPDPPNRASGRFDSLVQLIVDKPLPVSWLRPRSLPTTRPTVALSRSATLFCSAELQGARSTAPRWPVTEPSVDDGISLVGRDLPVHRGPPLASQHPWLYRHQF